MQPTNFRVSIHPHLSISSALLALVAACADDPEPEELEEVEAEASASYKASVKNRTLTITGSSASSKLTLRLGASPTILELDIGDDGSADLQFDRSRFERISIDGGGGDDVITINEVGVAFTTEEQVTIHGGSGNDTIVGGVGPETLLGGAGNDTVTGRFGVDRIDLGGGNDVVVWEPGGASDVIDGGDGLDTLRFIAASANDTIELAANGDRLRLTRDIAAITLDVGTLEVVDLQPRGGTDRIVVHDLGATDVSQVNVDLLAPFADLVADSVILTGTAGADTVDVALDGTTLAATGLAAEVRITAGEPAFDRLLIDAEVVNVNGTPAADVMVVVPEAGLPIYDGGNFPALVATGAVSAVTMFGLGGDDRLAAVGGIVTPLVLDGGDGDDELVGGHGADTLRGGAGNDTVTGGGGADVALLGEGDDRFEWNPGGSSDVVEGEGGVDTLAFHASNANDSLDVRASGSRVRVFRDISATTTDLDGVERLDVYALGGSDLVVIHPLAGTAATSVNVDLLAVGTGDTLADQVVLDGSASDTIAVTGDGPAVVATGIGATVRVTNGEPALDRLVAYGLALEVHGTPGPDTLSYFPDAGELAIDGGGYNVLVSPRSIPTVTLLGHAGDDRIASLGGVTVPLVLDGGDGNDTLYGGFGADRLLGGPGDDVVDGGGAADVALLGEGDDTFVFDPGDGSDVVEGELGTDAFVFNASNASDLLELRPAGAGRARIYRSIGSTTTDFAGIEHVTLHARGGSDTVTVGDLAGTGVTQATIDLAAIPGTPGGDALLDTVSVLGTDAPDAFTIANEAGTIVVGGLAAAVRIAQPEAIDQLALYGLGGTDTFTAGPGVSGAITVVTIPD